MKARELSGEHIGRKIHIKSDGYELSDTIAAVSHEANLIDDRKMMDPGPRWIVGRATTRIKFLSTGEIEVSPEMEIGRVAS